MKVTARMTSRTLAPQIEIAVVLRCDQSMFLKLRSTISCLALVRGSLMQSRHKWSWSTLLSAVMLACRVEEMVVEDCRRASSNSCIFPSSRCSMMRPFCASNLASCIAAANLEI